MQKTARSALALLTACAVSAATAVGSPAAGAPGGSRLEGLLVDVDGRTASGFTLHLIDRDGRDIRQSMTAADGLYSFSELAPGSYSLGIEDPAGRMAVVDAPPFRLGRDSLARRDVRLMQGGPEAQSAAFAANPSIGLWWAGLSPQARVWTVVGVVLIALITVKALDSDGGETDASPVTPIP